MSTQEVKRIVQALSAGKIIAVETDTIPGFAVDGTNRDALQRLFEFKQRPKKMPIAWLIADYRVYRKDFEMDEKVEALAENFWPGALTLVLKKRNTRINDEDKRVDEEPSKGSDRDFSARKIESFKNTQGLRMPNHRGLLHLLSVFGKPLATSSANISGSVPCSSIKEVGLRFSKQISAGELTCVNLPREFDHDSTKQAASVVIDVTSRPWSFIRPNSENRKVKEVVNNGEEQLAFTQTVDKKTAMRKPVFKEVFQGDDRDLKNYRDEKNYWEKLAISIFAQKWEILPVKQKKMILSVLRSFEKLF